MVNSNYTIEAAWTNSRWISNWHAEQ